MKEGIRDLLFPQKATGLVGKEFSLTILSTRKVEIEVVGCPAPVVPIDVKVKGRGKVYIRFEAKGLSYQPKLIKFKATDLETGEVEIVEVIFRVFGSKEFFVCLVQTSNIHYGWNPEPTEQYFRKSDDELVLFKDEKMGNDAFVHALKLEKIFHKHGAPITWLIDDTVAFKAARKIKNWHWQYGDDYGILPRSYFYHNCRNYNIDHSADEITDLIQLLRDNTQEIFCEAGYPCYSRTMGVDQWVGSVETNFVKAAQNLGLEAIWGIGYDHLSCDTSMFHRGAPWDIYKPKEGNFRVPGIGTGLWIFQWTTRDILNTSYFSPNGATIFSTDADDIRSNHIPAYQNDYYARMLHEYKKNMPYNEVGIFLVHQEDHDSHIELSNVVLEDFVDQTFDDNLFVTIEEAVNWLNLKYAPEEHPYQILEIEDPLTCHREMKQEALAGYISPQFAEYPEWGDGSNPKHLAYYGLDAMWIGRFPARIPFIFYDYQHSKKYEFVENGQFPRSNLPKVKLLNETWSKIKKSHRLSLSIRSSKSFANLPFIFWESPIASRPQKFTIDESSTGPTKCYKNASAMVIILKKVTRGNNLYEFVF